MQLTRTFARSWDSDALVRAHPPVRLTSNKRAVFERACPPGRPARGTIEATRWSSAGLPPDFAIHPASIEIVDGWFEYAPEGDPAVPEWHMNFASSVAFQTYTLALFAQDEMQVLEHPALMSVHEALVFEGRYPATVERRRRPTPVLVRGVERRCAIDTAPDASAGRPRGLYGGEFERAPVSSVLAATRVLDPPSTSRIIAIEAPVGGAGPYRADEIAFILETAWAGFAAAIEVADGLPTVIHSGYWGCGAYGGNRVLMSLLQVAAARATGLERLVIHAGDDPKDAREGVRLAQSILDGAGSNVGTEDFIRRVERLGLRWGVGNGT